MTITKIETVAGRAAHRGRAVSPYLHRISKGCYLGYRRMTSEGAGSWVARALDGATGKQAYKALGEFADMPEHQRFDAARKDAAAWFDHLGKGGATSQTTVGAACVRYVDRLRETKGARAADDAKAASTPTS